MQALLPAIAEPASLRYAGASEATIPGGAELSMAAVPHDRFGVCLLSDLTVNAGSTKERPVRVPAGSLFYLPKHLQATFRSATSQNSSIWFLSFSASDFPDKPSGREGAQIRVFRLPQMKNWVKDFPTADEILPLPDYYQAQSRLYAIAAAYAASLRHPRKEETDDGFVEEARQTIRDNYESALDMEELARIAGVGSSRFYRSFRKQTGLSPLKYLTMIRLAASLRLLADPEVSVTEAAHSVGYPDEYYFSRMFKKQMGLAPTEYASRAQRSVAILCPIFAGDLAVLGLAPCLTLGRDWDLDEDNRERYLQEVRQAKPDLILAGPLDDGLVRELRAIAPITVYEWHARPWQRRLSDFSALLGLESVADRWLSDFASKTDNARQRVVERWSDTPYLIVGVREGNFRVYGKQRRKFTDLLYDELGFAAPAEADAIGFKDTPTLDEVIGIGSDNALFLIELETEDAFCEDIEIRWKAVGGGTGEERNCVFLRLGKPFLYNAAMHERLVDRIVDYIYAGEKT